MSKSSGNTSRVPIEDEPVGCCDTDLSSSQSSYGNSSLQIIDGPQCGSEVSCPRRTGPPSRVSFHSIFGDSEEQITSLSDEPNNQTISIRSSENEKIKFCWMEFILFLYFGASALIKFNLLQMFRLKECLAEYELSLDKCQVLQSEGILHDGEINYLANELMAIRDAVQYLFGAVLAFVSSRYLNKYGPRDLLSLCLLGTFTTTILFLAESFFVTSPIFVCFLEISPAILTGGDTLMMTLTSVHIAKTSKNNELRWRFFIYGFVLIFPQALLNLLDANDFKDISPKHFNGIAVVLMIITGMLSRCVVFQSFTGHSIRQRLRTTFTVKKLQESFNCFTKRRECRGRIQLILSIVVFALISAFSNVFSVLRGSFFNQAHHWNPQKFVGICSVAMIGCFIVGLIVMCIFTFAIHPVDPLVTFIGCSCLTVSHILMAVDEVHIVACSIALGLQLAPVIGIAYLRSHLCQHLETSEIGSVFAVICSCEAAMPFIANIAFKVAITETTWLNSHLYVMFSVSAVVLCVASIAALYIYLITRRRWYPLHSSQPTVDLHS